MGQLLTALVVIYVSVLFVLSRVHVACGHMARFLVPLSVLQVLPDWVLSEVLGVLVFAEDGAPRIGSVNAYMAGLWTVPLVAIVATGLRAEERGYGTVGVYGTVAVMSLVVFGVAEATLGTFVWHCRDVATLGDHTALYILLPEMLLGWATFYAYRTVSAGSLVERLLGALAVAMFYTGCAVTSYLLVERVFRIGAV